MLGIPSSSSSLKIIGFQEGDWSGWDTGGGTSSDSTMEDTGFDSGRSALADSWSGDRVPVAAVTFTWSTCVEFNDTTGGFGGSIIEGAVLRTKCGQGVGSVPSATLSGPHDTP